ncbi:MAG: hypothetical protein Q8N66_13700 [Bacteroidota bacterium]|nr:hypothetical protein [Bacteroidota bacterium]
MRGLIFISIFATLSIFGQTQDVLILKYNGKEKNHIKKTDSSVIETKFFPDFGYIGEFNELKKEKKIYYKQFDYATKILTEEGIWVNGWNVGLWKYYSADGKLEKTINYDNGETKQFSGTISPFKNYFDFIKSKADSILKTNLGLSFFQNNISWNASNSYYYGPSLAGRWFEETSSKPNIFLLRYDVLLEKDIKFSLIEFYLDSTGNLTNRFLPDDNKGIRRCNNNSNDCKFNITTEKAYNLAKDKGMKMEKDKYFIYLEYNPDIKTSDSFGDYELIVADYNRTETRDNRTTHFYNALVIDPWTGKIKEEISLTQSIVSHKNSAYHSGLKRIK